MFQLKTARRALLSAIAAAALLAISSSHAQDRYPARSVRIVVGSEAGSAPDVLARALANEMGPLLGQSVIVDNRAGAAGTIGAASVAGAPADGYTLLMGTVSNVALAPSFYQVKYDPVKSFTTVGMVASVPLVLVVNPGLGIATLADLRARPRKEGEFNYSSPGVGGPQHLAGVLLARQLGAPLTHIPYKSGGAAMAAVAAGDAQLAFAGIPAAAGLVQGRKVVPLLVTSPRRSPALGDVPTAAEAGLPGFEIDNWHALLAPPALPAPVRSVLESALQRALAAPAIREQFAKVGAEPITGSGAQAEAYVAAETQRWARVVADNKLKVE